MHRTLIRALIVALPLGGPAAQANANPDIDVKHGPLSDLTFKGRTGEFPGGLNGVAMSTTSCNVGSVNVPWLSVDEDCFSCGPFGGGCQMVEDHPFIAFMLARQSGGRLEQISNYSRVKHGFFALSDSQCDTCTGGSPNGNFLGVGCSDTYTHFNNGDDFYLGPAEEIDPWLGTWEHVGSFFDRGFPDAGFPENQDGVRSWCSGSDIGPLGFKVRVSDADLSVENAEYFYQGYYVIESELESLRENNSRSRRFEPTWNGSSWSFDSVPMSNGKGSILERWTGATVSSATNGDDDGRVYVAVHVTGPEDGIYRYEVAVHNRDAHRKVGLLSLPLAEGAHVQNAGFRDIDRDSANDWHMRVGTDRIAWRAQPAANNPLRWNSFYNFWFETDAAPLTGSATYGAHDPGPGADLIEVAGLPLPLDLPNLSLGGGCSFGAAPTLVATGQPAVAFPGNGSFGLRTRGNDAGARTFALVALGAGPHGPAPSAPLACDALLGVPGSELRILGPVLADGEGVADFGLPIPALQGLEGLHLRAQAVSERASGGPLLGHFDLSNGIRIRTSL